MFGYIKPYTPELRVRDNEYFKALYCGVCRSLGKSTGELSRLTLNYDLVFASLLRLAATGKTTEISARRCIMHPMKKRPMATPCDELVLCARIGVLLAYHKAADDVSDERGARRARAKLLRGLMKGMRGRAKKALSMADGIISSGLSHMSDMEKNKVASVDAFADEFGNIMKDVISVGLEGTEGRIIGKIGYHLGRWLYIIDAADDYSDDVKKGRFNPFALIYEERPFDEYTKENIFNALSADLMQMYSAFELLSKGDGQDEIFALTDNILRLGMPHAAATALGIEKYIKQGDKNDRSL